MVMSFDKVDTPKIGCKSYEGDINAWLKVRTISRIKSIYGCTAIRLK